jgi:hypothetical protein
VLKTLLHHAIIFHLEKFTAIFMADNPYHGNFDDITLCTNEIQCSDLPSLALAPLTGNMLCFVEWETLESVEFGKTVLSWY